MVGIAIGTVLALIGVVMAAMGWSSAPTGRDVMLFQGGMVLLAGGGVAFCIGALMRGTAKVEAAINRLVRIADAPPPARMEAEPDYAPEPRHDQVIPAGVATGVATATAATLAPTETPAVDDTTPDMLPPTLPPPELSIPANEDRWSSATTETFAPVATPSLPLSTLPVSPLPIPPLPPRVEPVFETPAPAEPEPVFEPAPLFEPAPMFEPAPEPVTVELPEPPIDIEAQPAAEPAFQAEPPAVVVQPIETGTAIEADPFDLEAAIAAELGLEPAASAPAETPSTDETDDISVDFEPLINVGDDGTAPAEAIAEPEPAMLPDAETPADSEPDAVTAEAEESPTVSKTPIGSHESGGIIYTLYDDGSVTARQGDVEEHYNSLDELRAAFSG
jgi:hypothetical protein